MAKAAIAQRFQPSINSNSIRFHCAETAEIDTSLPINHCNSNRIGTLQPQITEQGQSQAIIFNFSPTYRKSFEHEVLKFSSTSSVQRPQLQHDHSTNQHSFNSSVEIAPSISGNSFTLFPKLPLELQFKIWQLAARQPRIIGINDLESKGGLCGNSARCQLMLTSKQARQEAIREKRDWNGTHTSAQPKIWVNFAVDTLWLNIERADFYDHNLPPLWQQIMGGPHQNIRKLAVSYSLFKRRWDQMNAMVFKLDLEQLILVVDAEKIMPDDHAVYAKPRSAVERRAQVWKDWDGVTRSEIRQLKDCLETAKYAYNRSLRKGATPEELLLTGKRDLTNWRMPRLVIRNIANSKNVSAEELTSLVAEEEEYEGADEAEADESESEDEYE